jgi:hypothetical protein
MNTAVSWIAVRGMDKAAILAALGLVEVAEDDRRARQSVATLPSGWVLVFTVDFGFPTPERMRALSAGGVAIACSADDRAMGSVLRGYSDGRASWAIEHDGGSKGPYHMEVDGVPPPEWPAIRERLTKEQEAEDADEGMVDCLYDAPMELAFALCGYRHDQPRPEGQELKFALVGRPKGSNGRGVMAALSGLFGRR